MGICDVRSQEGLLSIGQWVKGGRRGLLGTGNLFLGLGAYYVGVFMKLNT